MKPCINCSNGYDKVTANYYYHPAISQFCVTCPKCQKTVSADRLKDAIEQWDEAN